MHNAKRTWPAWLVAAALAYGNAPAGERESSAELALTAGYGYDSNVGIVDLDQVSGTADNAARLRAALDVRAPVTSRGTATLGVEFDRTAYEQLDAFDLDLLHASAGLAYQLAGFETAITVDRFDAALGGDDYLDLTQLTPSLGQLIGNDVYARVGYTSGTKRYEELPSREADIASLRADVYFLLDGMDRYVAFGIQSGAEDAIDATYDYDTTSAALTFGHTLRAWRLAPAIRGELRYESRDYAAAQTDAGNAREDRRWKAGVSMVVPFGEYLELAAEAARARSDSSLESARWNRNQYGVTLTATFQ